MTIASDGGAAGGSRGRQFVLRLFAIFLVLVGLACFAYPLLYFFVPERAGLIDDTRAYFGAGTAEGVPTVGAVHCTAPQRNMRRGQYNLISYDCTLYLQPAESRAPEAAPGIVPPPVAGPSAPPPMGEESGRRSTSGEMAQGAEPTADPGEAMDRTRQEFERYNEEFLRSMDAIRSRATSEPLERELPTDRTGDIPTLRRLSAADQPPRYGVIWGGGELALRWLSFGFFAALAIGFGTVLLYVARAGWRRARR